MSFRPTRNHETGEWETPTKARIKGLIEEGFLSIRAAEQRFGVPYSTIRGWMSSGRDRRPHSLQTGRPQKLNKRD